MLGKDGTLCLPTNIILGYLADIARLPVTMPLDLLSTRMQTSTSGSLVAKILKSNPHNDFTKHKI
jgi:hypothetical protein